MFRWEERALKRFARTYGQCSVPKIPANALSSVWTCALIPTTYFFPPFTHKTIKNLAIILEIPETHPVIKGLNQYAQTPRSIVNNFGSNGQNLMHVFGMMGPTCVYQHPDVLERLIIFSRMTLDVEPIDLAVYTKAQARQFYIRDRSFKDKFDAYTHDECIAISEDIWSMELRVPIRSLMKVLFADIATKLEQTYERTNTQQNHSSPTAPSPTMYAIAQGKRSHQCP
jgi:hypothetical protein